MENRIRKTINVSLQSRKYCTPMNELINEWEADGCNLSIKVCEQLLKLSKLEKSATFIKVLNLFELTEKMASVYNIEDEAKIEDILSKVIQIDNAGLSEIFMTLNQIDKGKESFPVDSTKLKPIEEKPPLQKEESYVLSDTVRKEDTSSILKVSSSIEDTTEDEASKTELDIPLDFLMNS